jgi:ABC-type transport system involved in multi-copper enzyme maturation permease subunit
MTASIIGGPSGATPVSVPFGPFAGFRPLLRKDATEWIRARRTWVILAVSGLFMVLAAANSWLISRFADTLPPGEAVQSNLGSLVPADNVLAAVASQIFVIATVMAAGSLLARERETGTLSWVASKPVTRRSIWLSKWASSTAMLSILAGLIPLAATVAVVTVLYGAPPVALVVGLSIGIVAVVAFFAAVGLAAGAFLPGQPAAIAAGIAVLALLPVIAGLIPFPIDAYLPTSMLAWPVGALSGQAVSFATPIAWLVVTSGVVAISIRRMGRLEL